MLMNAINFVVSHQVVFAALGIAILDLAFALSPSVNGNGILHQVYVLLKKDSGQA